MKLIPFGCAVGLLAGLFAGSPPARAQAPAWQSARAVAVATVAATSDIALVNATAVDAAGNVYLTGSFTNTVTLGGITLTSAGSYDVFVAKFSPATNQFVWAQRAGGAGFDVANALAVSGTSVYVAGNMNSAGDFGPTVLTGAGQVFVGKLTDAGGFGWVQQVAGARDNHAYALAVSGPSVYVAGEFNSPTAGFGATTLANTGNFNTTEVFVAKLLDAGTTGSFAWAQRAGGMDNDRANALAVSGPNVYVAGQFNSPTAGFGTTSLANRQAGYDDVFVAKLTDAGATGSFDWAQRAGGVFYDRANALAVRGSSVYVAGQFDSPTAGFGATTLTNVGGLGTREVFVAKLTDAGATGSFAWAQRAGGSRDDEARALAVSGASVYVAGGFSSPTAGFGSTTLTNPAYYNVFVAKLTDAGATGSFAWAQRADSGIGGDAANALALSGTSVYVAGGFNSAAISFGTTTLNAPNNTYRGFLASLTDPTITTTTATGRTLAPAQLFPNPARHTATLRLPAGAARTPLTLADAQGRAVRQYPAPAGAEAALDLRGLPAGLYLLRGAGPAQRLVVE